MLRDFLVGTVGRLLQIIFALLGLGLVFVGLVGLSASTVLGVLCIIGGVLCFCAVYGIRYAIGHIIRHRE